TSGPRGRASPRSHRESRDAASGAGAAAHALTRRRGGARRIARPDPAARRTRSRRARTALRHRHARLRVSGADPGRRQPERRIRGVHGKGTQAAPRSGRRRGRAVGQSLPPRHPAPLHARAGQRPRVREPAGRSSLPAVAVDDRAARRGPRRPPPAHLAARAASLVREPSPRRRRRPALDPGDARPRRYRDDADLHASAVGDLAANVSALPSAGVNMAKRAHVYPQVSLAAADLADLAIAPAAAGVGVTEALVLARKRNAAVVAAGASYVLRDDLVRATSLGLGALRASQLARAVPDVDPGAGEGKVRRLLATGAPLVIVRGPRGAAGAVSGRFTGARLADASAAGRVVRGLPDEVRELLGTVGRIAEEQDGRAYLVGGLVRDLRRGATPSRRDLDIVVEGDGPALAQRLAHALGGSVVEHRRFLTASVETPKLGKIDVATSRSERYESPGALPRVLPAGIAEDLRRRDFTVNAMAIELSSGEFGLIDPLGGRLDLARRRLRVLHPLSYVEDPTRIFRAARYAARLGLAPDRATISAQALALRLVPYAALSGQRIATELELILSEPQAGAILLRLGRSGAFRLLDPSYRFAAASRRRVGALPETL